MNRDGNAVKYLLEKDAATLVQYQDRQAESMLHLACIFNLNDIALALVSKTFSPGDYPSVTEVSLWRLQTV